MNRRVHHIDVGVAGLITTLIVAPIAHDLAKDENTKRSIIELEGRATGFFGQLAWDDRADISELFKFEEK
jgi:hypothetical protein